MKTMVTSFAAALVTSAVATPIVRDIARRRGALDDASSSRKVHRVPTPRLGGIAIAIAFVAPLTALFFVNSSVGAEFVRDPRRAFGLFGGGLAIASLGVLDDIKGTRARVKFLVQVAVAVAMYGLGYRAEAIATPFGLEIQLGWMSLPFTVFWIVGIINAVNLIDGLDGLAGGVAFIGLVTVFVASIVHGERLLALFSATLGGAVLGFLLYNFNPASIFMGDTGSMFLGLVLATTSIEANERPSHCVALVIPILALGLPIADTVLAMGRRAARGVPMFSADRGHIHHRLLELGLSHRGTVLVLYGVSVVLGIAAIGLTYATASQEIWFLLGLAGVSYLGLRRLGFIDLGKAEEVLEVRRRNLRVRAAMRRVGAVLRSATCPTELFSGITLAAQVLDAEAVRLCLADGAEEDGGMLSQGFDRVHAGLLRTRHALGGGPAMRQYVEFGWNHGRTRIDRDTEIAVELLCNEVDDALARMRADRPRQWRQSFRSLGGRGG
jgi:UDP-GlcNAc:undecaprenyl-phosphate GlcNAc-1-phosphate transferase